MDDIQIKTAVEILDQQFDKDLLAVYLYGSRINKALTMTSDIDILVFTKCNDLTIIIERLICVLFEQKKLYGDINRLIHTPLLIISEDLPLFPPTFSLGLLNHHLCLFGDKDFLRIVLLQHINANHCIEKSCLWMHVYWDLQRVCKEIIDTYVEYSAWNKAKEDMLPVKRKAFRRIVKAYVYGSKLIGFLYTQRWFQKNFSELEEATDITGLINHVRLNESSLNIKNVVAMLTPLIDNSKKIRDSFLI